MQYSPGEFLHHPNTAELLGPNVLLGTLFLNRFIYGWGKPLDASFCP